jgi:hypothetical protein
MEYQIVRPGPSYAALNELERKVNDLIKKGWKPLGGVSIARTFGPAIDIEAVQAMIKE